MKTIMLPAKGCSLAVYPFACENAESTLVFLQGGPGAPASSVQPYPVLKALQQRFNVIYFDQRGGGNSILDFSPGITEDDALSDVTYVVQYAKKLFSKPVYLLGTSYGGALALLFSSRYADAIEGTVLFSPAMLTLNNPDYVAICLTQAKSMAASFPSDFSLPSELQQKFENMDGTKEDFLRSVRSEALSQFIKENPQPIPGIESLWFSWAMADWFLEDFDLRPLLSGLSLPVLLLQGDKDEICPEPLLTAAATEADNENISYRVISGCTHDLLGDAGETIEPWIISFCSKMF